MKKDTGLDDLEEFWNAAHKLTEAQLKKYDSYDSSSSDGDFSSEEEQIQKPSVEKTIVPSKAYLEEQEEASAQKSNLEEDEQPDREEDNSSKTSFIKGKLVHSTEDQHTRYVTESLPYFKSPYIPPQAHLSTGTRKSDRVSDFYFLRKKLSISNEPKEVDDGDTDDHMDVEDDYPSPVPLEIGTSVDNTPEFVGGSANTKQTSSDKQNKASSSPKGRKMKDLTPSDNSEQADRRKSTTTKKVNPVSERISNLFNTLTPENSKDAGDIDPLSDKKSNTTSDTTRQSSLSKQQPIVNSNEKKETRNSDQTKNSKLGKGDVDREEKENIPKTTSESNIEKELPLHLEATHDMNIDTDYGHDVPSNEENYEPPYADEAPHSTPKTSKTSTKIDSPSPTIANQKKQPVRTSQNQKVDSSKQSKKETKRSNKSEDTEESESVKDDDEYKTDSEDCTTPEEKPKKNQKGKKKDNNIKNNNNNKKKNDNNKNKNDNNKNKNDNNKNKNKTKGKIVEEEKSEEEVSEVEEKVEELPQPVSNKSPKKSEVNKDTSKPTTKTKSAPAAEERENKKDDSKNDKHDKKDKKETKEKNDKHEKKKDNKKDNKKEEPKVVPRKKYQPITPDSPTILNKTSSVVLPKTTQVAKEPTLPVVPRYSSSSSSELVAKGSTESSMSKVESKTGTKNTKKGKVQVEVDFEKDDMNVDTTLTRKTTSITSSSSVENIDVAMEDYQEPIEGGDDDIDAGAQSPKAKPKKSTKQPTKKSKSKPKAKKADQTEDESDQDDDDDDDEDGISKEEKAEEEKENVKENKRSSQSTRFPSTPGRKRRVSECLPPESTKFYSLDESDRPHEEEIEGNALERRPKRRRIAPLKFWKGERVVYGRSPGKDPKLNVVKVVRMNTPARKTKTKPKTKQKE
eukprot:TRINITY_DN2815_c0_g1_i2.p1 TRINITY_DN2815_c0_g1~~TRINITY_DN2815_c0_g1_i2.p1  ORF type:complete len:906 (+),score=327.30 TRINITY_DN2815_c0_g1_i2:305-3022(+)